MNRKPGREQQATIAALSMPRRDTGDGAHFLA
jgi:hypothetical protein